MRVVGLVAGVGVVGERRHRRIVVGKGEQSRRCRIDGPDDCRLRLAEPLACVGDLRLRALRKDRGEGYSKWDEKWPLLHRSRP